MRGRDAHGYTSGIRRVADARTRGDHGVPDPAAGSHRHGEYVAKPFAHDAVGRAIHWHHKRPTFLLAIQRGYAHVS
jgi:hypothetical protein